MEQINILKQLEFTIGAKMKRVDIADLSLKIPRVGGLYSIDKAGNITGLGIKKGLKEIPYEIGQLKFLTVLILDGNRISDLSLLKDCKKLTRLELRSNKISNISALENLSNIAYLALSHNQIQDFNCLKKLINIRTLWLTNTGISDTSFLTGFPLLETLGLHANNISDISFLKQLLKLQTVVLSSNPIKVLDKGITDINIPIRFGNAFKKGFITLSSHKLEKPPVEVVERGREAIINYFHELEIRGTDYLYEAKMLIVGQPRAGKTSLRYKLFDSASALPSEDKTTRGIDIERLEFDINDADGRKRKFYYNVWDFGGQQIYQTTHQFFLTHRSLYVLVMDTGKDAMGNDDATINYWLQALELLGGGSPLLLVKNEKNERIINIDLPSKKTRFNFLKNDYSVDLNALIPATPCYSKQRARDFSIFKEDVETELKRLPLIGLPMPKNWVAIRNELQSIAKTKPYISRQDYTEICEQFDVKDPDRQLELSRIFHDLGVFLHFQDFAALEEIIILQNTWATDAVFAVFDNTLVKKNNGRFSDSDLSSIWKEKGYSSNVHKKLLALMMQFELCYQIETSSPATYIIPEMLADKSPEGYHWEIDSDLPLQYRYDFMPRGILTRLIVRLNKHIQSDNGQQFVWKTGVKIDGKTLDCPKTFAEITEAWDNKQLSVRIKGVFSKDMMNKITYEIDRLNENFFKSNSDDNAIKSRWHKMIPCICPTCKNSSDKYFHDYEELLARKEFGKDTIECKKIPFETIKIDDLIDGIFAKQKNTNFIENEKNMSAAKIFISYAHKDEKWKDKLVVNLSSLRSQGLISDWNDRKIEAGFWDEQIENAMNETDIFLMLITPNFLASDYISSKEITKAYSLFKAGKAKIFPIICDTCDWELQPISEEREMHPVEKKEMKIWLGKFQPFPKDGRPIKKWSNQQDAFKDITTKLRQYL